MEKSLLQKLYDGELFPSENINPADPKYNELKRALASETDHFTAILYGDERECFEKINSLYYEAASIYNYECFANGFWLAVNLMVESLNVKNNSAGSKGE